MSKSIEDSRIQIGCTFFIPSGPAGDHLFIVIKKRIINFVPHLLLANLSSLKNLPSDDLTCIVEPGEHSFAHKRSFIKYSDCRTEKATDVITMLDKGVFKFREGSVSAELLIRIVDGLNSSKVKRHIKNDWC